MGFIIIKRQENIAVSWSKSEHKQRRLLNDRDRSRNALWKFSLERNKSTISELILKGYRRYYGMDFTKKRIIIYGTLRQRKDIEYVFDELDIAYHTESQLELIQYMKRGYFAILCKKDTEPIIELLKQEELYEGYIQDQELIKTLNFPILDFANGRKIVVWGTGCCCTEFEESIIRQGRSIPINGYVDNNSDKVGEKKTSILNGPLPILSPSKINPEEYYVIIATNYENGVSIEEDLAKLGFGKKDYVYYRTVQEDVAGYFHKIYATKLHYKVECKNKDRSVRVSSNGDVCTCCMAYASVYGNLYEDTFEEIWKSRRATISRLALENKTYVHCDTERCSYLMHVKPEQMDDTAIEQLQYRHWTEEYPNSIALELDRSCNLYCTSCRDHVYVENNPAMEIYTDLLLNKVINLPTRLILNPIGEAFASKYCLKLIHHEKTRKRETISLCSNGTLLNPKVLDQLLKEYKSIELSISIDAATEDTYCKIRRNGDFKALSKNLEYMSHQRKCGRVTYFQINYVLQADNITEMKAFVEWGKQLGVDRIDLFAIENWGNYTKEEFEKVSIFRNGEIKEEFLNYFTKEILEEPIVDVANCANALGVKPKLMYMV